MEINELVKKQREYFYTGSTLSYDFRKNQLLKLKESLKNNQEDIIKAFKEDFNKCEFDAIATEYSMIMMELDYNLKHLKKFMKVKKVKTDIVNFPSKGYIYKDPYGVCLIMAPWNYPLQLALEPLIGAIAAGNCAIVKPSNYALNVSNAIKKVLSVFDEEYISVVLGGREQNQELLNQKFDYIFFTGGTTVGKLVMEKASENLTPVSLELGGKSPCIICDDADLDLASKRLVWGKYLNAGQTCVAPDYVYVDTKVKDEFINKVIEKIKEYYYVDGKLREDFCYIINDKHITRLSGLIDETKVAFGGNIVNRLIEPTVMIDVKRSDAVMKEEIFGPIMPIMYFDDFESVVNEIKVLEHPLASYLFTNNKAKQEYFLKNVQFGGGCINDTIMHLTNTNLPFGGVGNSGMGSYHGKKSFDTFTHEKSVFKKGKMEIDIKYPPYNDKKLKWLKKFTKC